MVHHSMPYSMFNKSQHTNEGSKRENLPSTFVLYVRIQISNVQVYYNVLLFCHCLSSRPFVSKTRSTDAFITFQH